MRHQMKKVKLDRKAGPRKALLANLVASLVLYEKITTTKAKAKATKSLVEKMITKAKANTLAKRREIAAVISQDNVVRKLMEVLGPRYAERKGGYTRIIMIKNRQGDGAETALIEFV